ncbi:MAG: hypothetical protein VW397_08995 [Candidatus Margulisiibacteriota bacterium]
MTGKMDYDKSEPKIKPVLISILLSLIVIFVICFVVILYFKGTLTIQEEINENQYGKSFDLKQLNDWENNYLNETGENKVNINEAIRITINQYRN